MALLKDGHDSGGRGGSGAGSDHFGRHLGSLRAALRHRQKDALKKGAVVLSGHDHLQTMDSLLWS